MGTSLYELTADYAALKDAVEYVDEATGEVIEGDALAALLAGLKGDLTQKAGGCLMVAAEFRHRAAALKAEEERMAKRRRILENAEERLRHYVRDCMATADVKKLTAGTFTITRVEGRETVAMDPERREEVPEHLRVYDWKPLTKEAQEQFKQTGTLPPGFVVKRGEGYVRIA